MYNTESIIRVYFHPSYIHRFYIIVRFYLHIKFDTDSIKLAQPKSENNVDVVQPYSKFGTLCNISSYTM